MAAAVLLNGFWGTNIGNAFFNLGGRFIAEETFEKENVSLIGDHPGYWTFNRQGNGFRKNSKNYFLDLDLDWLILQGPLFTKNFPEMWGDTLIELKKRGV